ncbi:hypothetical protein A2X44_01220 [candidate division CPR3 bacterium GWF2_35_18]|uniref:Right handed beta helix domain-containing protein n=1 Tax=candidate division CPR3 bacterium GW2011_GWF2_35_18 TaxID=1618350 RepID=A0A0G0BLD5_UNCC3|nr:MAG: hypothetical protein UR67_C0001G0223 [candidate division CPR3 bacterium GW2011_GWF2_35_18]KKP86456.1 MAG: hypothetical protein UR87_C0019G0015 [candidate division CPR3 bacterium GW2011_GWE2_35_7]OGB63522.1 MAG: hypothetical protein A2X44_01220 [candidate division CPR3 bacterium GWF2_35_18]OGB64631.1 MAG: hypothetical protein A2250_03770 [candidate division CPR3 bacterium RIFOXYA2_FULL_35_13]OGB80356.1 MAG: hypothetical protein A2011_00670 [candidate division CPR3 bacterium GWE2_35_7]
MKKNFNSYLKILLLFTFIINLLIILLTLTSINNAFAPERIRFIFSEVLKEGQLAKFNSTKSEIIKTKYFIENSIKISNQNYIKEVSENSKISIIEVKADYGDLMGLDLSLPESGRVPVTIEIKEGNNNWQEAELKYRGDSLYHWAFEKKSYSIKKEDGSIINLINPKSSDFVADKMSEDLIASEFNLLTPGTDWVSFFINGQFKGVYQQVEDISDSFALKNKLSVIFEGEHIGSDGTSGYSLFVDPMKWKIEGGQEEYIKLNQIINALNSDDVNDFYKYSNIESFADFYSFVSFIQNIHYDSEHNWKLGYKNSQFYPIVWDPVSWIQSYGNDGNSIEDIKSPIAITLRKNVYFNQLFSEKLWGYINNENFYNKINHYLENEKETLKDILDYDVYKGASHQNPNGMRYPQTTKEIFNEIDSLKLKINTRVEFLRAELSKATASYFIENDNLYITYIGIGGSFLELNQPYQSIELYNKNQYVTSPEINNNQVLISGRTKSTLYANTCPTTYRIKIKNLDVSKIRLIHTLTRQEIKLSEIDELSLTDCSMNFDAITQENTQLIIENSNNLPILEINANTVHISDFFDFNEKVKENITVKVNSQNIKGEFKKSKYDDIIILKLDDLYEGRKKWILIERNDQNQKYIQAMSVSEKLGLAIPFYKEIYLQANGFNIGEYYLIENIDKGFIENNKMTFDTDIFDKDEIDTLDENNWDKIAFDPRESDNNTKLLEEFLKDVEDIKNIDQWVDIESFVDFYNFLALTGNENLDYLLYFDNTQGRFKFVPYYYTLYKNTNFEVKDSVIKNVVRYLEEKGYITYATKSEFTGIVGLQSNVNYDRFAFVNENKMQELVFPEDYELGVFKEKLNDNKIILEENSHYEINYDILIPSNIDLIINSGVNLKIAEGKSVITYGQVFALGNKDNPIIIKAKSDKNYGVFAVVGNQADGSEFEYVNFENGSETFFRNTYLSAEFTVYHAEAKISHCYVKGSSSDDGLNIKFAKADLSYTTFDSNSGDAFDGDFVTGDVYNNYFINNGNDGVDVSGSEVHIYNNHIQNSGDKCISVGENSLPLITNNFFDGCHTGMEVKDHSTVEAQNNVFIYNDLAINAYQKKDFFGGGYGKISNSIFYNNEKNLTYDNVFTGEKLLSDDSNIVIVNSLIDKLSRDENLLQDENKIGTETLQSIRNSNWIIDNIGLTESGFIHE